MESPKQPEPEVIEIDPTIVDKIKEVNKILKEGEPKNITVDSYTGYTGYKPQYVVDAMNVVFQIGTWGFAEVSNQIYDVQT